MIEFEQLRERAFRAGAISVGIGVDYYRYGVTSDLRFFMRLESNGWDRTYYGKTPEEVFRAVGIYLDERGIK